MRAIRSLPTPPSGGFTGLNAVYAAARTAIPFINLATGSIANNGALTVGTALPQTYSGGAWVWFATNTISAATPQGWYWVVFSSTTAGTIFNSTYTTGIPTLGVQTAFVTTGPGAFTGVVGEVFGPQIPIAAGAMGANGALRSFSMYSVNNTAGAKSIVVRFSGTGGIPFSSLSAANQLTAEMVINIANRGVTNSQVGTAATNVYSGVGLANGAVSSISAVDTTAATTLSFGLNKGVATDNMVLDMLSVEVLYGA